MLNDFKCGCPGVPGVRIHRSAERDRRAGRDGVAGIPPGPISGSAVSVLRPPEGPDQGAVLGRRRVCAGIQAVGSGELSMAKERSRGKAAHGAAVPLAHGRAECGAAESEPAGIRIEAGINCEKPLKTLAFCSVLWYN